MVVRVSAVSFLEDGWNCYSRFPRKASRFPGMHVLSLALPISWSRSVLSFGGVALVWYVAGSNTWSVLPNTPWTVHLHLQYLRPSASADYPIMGASPPPAAQAEFAALSDKAAGLAQLSQSSMPTRRPYGPISFAVNQRALIGHVRCSCWRLAGNSTFRRDNICRISAWRGRR